MKKINAAIIGIGFIGTYHYEGLRRLPYVHIRAICVHKPQDVERVKAQYDVDYVTCDWREIIADPAVQVIHNCTPNALHDEVNLAAIAAGKHIYAEKPLSITAQGAKQVWEAAKAAGIATGVNYQYRMNAAVQEMRSRIARGDGGRSLYVSGQYLQESVARHTDYTPRRIPETSPARAVLDIGVHWADTAAYVLGQPIARVYAQMHTHYPVRIDPATGREIQVRSDDTTAVMVEFADGTPGSALFSKCMLGHKNDLRVTVSGEVREYSWHQERCDWLQVGNRELGNETVYMDKNICDPSTAPYIAMPAGHVLGWQDAQRNALDAFYQSVVTGSYQTETMPYATFADGWRGNCFVEACLQSAKENRWVELPLT